MVSWTSRDTEGKTNIHTPKPMQFIVDFLHFYTDAISLCLITWKNQNVMSHPPGTGVLSIKLFSMTENYIFNKVETVSGQAIERCTGLHSPSTILQLFRWLSMYLNISDPKLPLPLLSSNCKRCRGTLRLQNKTKTTNTDLQPFTHNYNNAME